jgi:ABC-2 type transport system permease protein
MNSSRLSTASSDSTTIIRIEPRQKYISIAFSAMQRTITYRNTTILNIAANLASICVIYYLWKAIFITRSQLDEFDWHSMQTYILVSYAVNGLLSFQSEARMFHTIRTGAVATDLHRPLDYLKTQLSQAIGSAIVEGIIISVVTCLLGIFVLHIAPPPSLIAAIFFLISVSMGFIIKFLISYMTALLCFWTLNTLGLRWARIAITNIFSGALIPLQFFPDWLRPLVLATPFQAIVYSPLAIYLGDVTGTALIKVLIIQLAWAIVLWILARLLWIPSINALQIQGG